MTLDTDGTGNPGIPTGQSRVRQLAALGLLLVLLGGLAVYGWQWHADRSYVGSSQRVELRWDCGNGIFWTDAGTGIKWWAGHDPVMTGAIETAPRDAPDRTDPISMKHAAGTVHFDTRETATFTSDAGGTMPLTRQEPGKFYTMDCTLGPDG